MSATVTYRTIWDEVQDVIPGCGMPPCEQLEELFLSMAAKNGVPQLLVELNLSRIRAEHEWIEQGSPRVEVDENLVAVIDPEHSLFFEHIHNQIQQIVIPPISAVIEGKAMLCWTDHTHDRTYIQTQHLDKRRECWVFERGFEFTVPHASMDERTRDQARDYCLFLLCAIVLLRTKAQDQENTDP